MQVAKFTAFTTAKTWGEMFTMKSKLIGQPSIASDDDVQSVDQKNLQKTELHNFRTFM
jgi:hypothetical protein